MKIIKTIIKFVLGFVAAIFIIIAVFWGSLAYVSNYKIAEADTSVSPDGTYELVLQAVGEAEWPFGSASGRLVLYEGKSRTATKPNTNFIIIFIIFIAPYPFFFQR